MSTSQPAMVPTLRTLVAAASFAASPALPAQQPDPIAQPVVVRVQLADGTPMPGVTIHRDRGDVVPEAGDGWLREHDVKFRASGLPVVGRSDPDGRLTLLANDGRFAASELQAAPPFRSKQLVRDGDGDGAGYALCVERLEHFVVRALDVAGEALPGFRLTLQQNGRIEAVAVTDARGLATFGVDPATTARLTLVPFGWIGPTDDFPTVAKQLPDKHQDFTVPPFGRVRVRATVGGVPAAVPLHSVRMEAPRRATVHPPNEKPLHGVELGPVLVGRELRGSIHFDAGEVAFAAPAVARHGELVVVDVDADPARARLALQLVAPGLRPEKSSGKIGEALVQVGVTITARTDAGSFSFAGKLSDDGRLTVAPAIGGLRGTRLQRVDVDVLETETVSRGVAKPSSAVGPHREPFQRSNRMWSGTLALDRAIEPTTLDLGAIEVARHGEALRGQVVDEQGKPVARAAVDVTAEGAHASRRLWTDERGEFVFLQMMRDEQGRPAHVVATASRGSGPDALYSEPSPPTACGGFVTLVLASPARGHLAFSLRAPALPPHALQFAFVEASGRVRELVRERVEVLGPGKWKLGPLPAGRGTLRIQLRPGVLLRSVADVEIRADQTNADARLQDVDLGDVVRICRMRVVDEEGVPMAGARVEYRGTSDQWSIGPSDAGGVLEIVAGPPRALRIVVSAPGKQPVDVAEVRDGADVRLRALPHLCVALRGLPADVPRADVNVVLRSVVRENLGDTVDAPVGDGDTAHLPLPPPGRYHVRIGLRQPGGRSWTTVGQRADDVLVAADGDSIELVVDEAMCKRLRELLARK